MSRAKHTVTINLPEEFVALCADDMVCPTAILRGFIADLCGIIHWHSNPRVDGYNSNGSDEREFARRYYDRVGYPYVAQWRRREVGQGKSTCSQAANSNCRCKEPGRRKTKKSDLTPK